jgi:hypothetical protein
VDAAGNLYFDDDTRVRKVTPAGIISTVAGRTQFSVLPSGDGGPATSAVLRRVSGLAVDAAGNLFIAQVPFPSVRKVGTNGIITTVAGNGEEVGGFSGDGGPATSAQLSGGSVAVDAAGNFFIADYSNNRIRKVTPAGTMSTIAGTGTRGFSGDGGPATSAQLSSPPGVAVDAAGNLFILDPANNRIRKVTPAGIISTIHGPA